MSYTKSKDKLNFFRKKNFIYDEYYNTHTCFNGETLSKKEQCQQNTNYIYQFLKHVEIAYY